MLWIVMMILAVVQGLGEFLPISSKGHLCILESLFEQWGWVPESSEGSRLGMEIVLHTGTLATILVFYWRRIWNLLGQDRRVIGLLIVGSIPAAVFGLLAKRYLTRFLEDPLLAGLMLLPTGLLLLSTKRQQIGETTCRELSYGRAFLVGLFQACALLPGISRSGTTITAGLMVGLRRDEAATFSFLLAIPAVAGATLLHLKDSLKEPPALADVSLLAAAAVVSFCVGLISLKWLVTWLQRGRLDLFAWYVMPVGLAVVIWRLFLTP